MRNEGRGAKRYAARRWIGLFVTSVVSTYGCAFVSGLDEFELANETPSGGGGSGGMSSVSSSSNSSSASSTSSSTGVTSSSSSGTSSSSSSSVSSSGGGSPAPIVIGEIYQAGGKQGSDYSTDYVVLVNVSNMAVNVGGWALQHYKTGKGWFALALPNASIPGGGNYLIALFNDGGGGQGAALPNPDLSAPANSDWNLSTSNGEALAITKDTTVLATCNAPAIVDLVGLNASPPCSEGGAGAPASTTNTSAHRKAGETQDTNNNAVDFEIGPTSP